MSLSDDSQVSAVLQAAQAGDRQAAADLLPLVYDELRKLAGHKLAHQTPGQTLQPTDLVHEAYARIAGDSHVSWEGRQHFFFAAARAMRDILVEQARRKGAQAGGRPAPPGPG
jgi:RNA polymerase sigma factor (TIGR02999 family)